MTTATIFTPSDRIYTCTADATGSTLLDGILGDQSPQEFVELLKLNGTNDAEAVMDLCRQLSNSEGYFLAEGEAEAALEDLPSWYAVEEFTPRSAFDKIVKAAQNA